MTISKAEIRRLLATNDHVCERACVVMLERQTADERHGNSTKHSNGVGFNRTDAAFGTSLGEQVRAGKRLSPRQLLFARKILAKYAGQLVDAAEEKAAREEAQKAAARIF